MQKEGDQLTAQGDHQVAQQQQEEAVAAPSRHLPRSARGSRGCKERARPGHGPGTSGGSEPGSRGQIAAWMSAFPVHGRALAQPAV